jgi:uncharacterized membrane protein YkoI
MSRRTITAALVVLALGAGATGAAAALGGGDDEGEQVTGPAADRAERAALARFPGARVTSVERDGDGNARWEAEVTRPDGSTVDVALDRDYRIVAIDEESGRDDDSDDDADERGGDDADERGDDADERGDDDADARATGPAAERAGAAALARFPGGRVTSIERDADGGAVWEVEVTRSDGSSVDVDVDAAMRIVAVDDPE